MYTKKTAVLLFAATVAAQQASSAQAGQTLSNGAYVCNPAHSYPAGQTCVDGPTPTLATVATATATVAATVAATTTVQAGQTLSNGGYVCNPAHQYPSGQSCVDGPTPTLVTLTGSSSAPKAGETLSNGGYVCNPAHQYPSGQSCVDGPTPTLVTLTGTTPAAQQTTSAPKAGETLSNSAYVCNPAHSYPAGQTCVDGPTPTLSSIATGKATGATSAPAIATFTGGAVAQYAQPALLLLQPLVLALL